MGKTYTYHLRLERQDADRVLKRWYDEGLSRSAIIRMAIDDIPLRQVVERLAGMKVERPGEPYGMEKIPFSIHTEQRKKLDALVDSNVEASFVVRHSLRRYLDKTTRDLKLIPGTMRARGQQRKAIERSKLRDALTDHDALDPQGALARIAEARKGHAPSAAPPVPIRAPAIDWSNTGPVRPRRASSEAQEAALEFKAPDTSVRHPSGSDTLQAAMAGIKMPEPETVAEPAKPAPEPLSPLDILRKKKGP